MKSDRSEGYELAVANGLNGGTSMDEYQDRIVDAAEQAVRDLLRAVPDATTAECAAVAGRAAARMRAGMEAAREVIDEPGSTA